MREARGLLRIPFVVDVHVGHEAGHSQKDPVRVPAHEDVGLAGLPPAVGDDRLRDLQLPLPGASGGGHDGLQSGRRLWLGQIAAAEVVQGLSQVPHDRRPRGDHVPWQAPGLALGPLPPGPLLVQLGQGCWAIDHQMERVLRLDLLENQPQPLEQLVDCIGLIVDHPAGVMDEAIEVDVHMIDGTLVTIVQGDVGIGEISLTPFLEA
mmetsp:Transcript_143349/g.250237  ORF Transcript_143349/g.250237 Transcript_143349/m.250237 type:complete len:207 (+) Transcript_143349:324-944(+)